MSNADKVKPEVILNLDRPRKFILDLKGLRRAEEITGKSLFKLVRWSELGFSDLSYLLWAGLLGEDPTLTRDQSDELFDAVNVVDNFKSLMNFIDQAIARAMPNLSEEEIKAIEGQKKKVREAMGMPAPKTQVVDPK